MNAKKHIGKTLLLVKSDGTIRTTKTLVLFSYIFFEITKSIKSITKRLKAKIEKC